MLARVAFILGALLGAPASAADCARTDFDGAPISWCRVDLERQELRLWLNDESGAPFGSFFSLDRALQAEGKRLGVAMNGGMYHEDRSPVGHFIEDGEEKMRVITSDGPGNFGLLPNGVLCIQEDRAAILESRRYADEQPDCRFATQSGPMLVIDGALHPRFLKDSSSLNYRNGVGISADGREAVLAISDVPVNFHHFARFFRDHAGTPDALFLDGSVSKLHAPALGRSDVGRMMGPILGTVQPAD
ncbi:phosphodiester glycosidase family protein [Tranquillimonas alkanivorans]|uniref:Uncharacterized protein YigE, DUF2233 family n=1 Tax=Tranquillimonas alkanivorans TaxID=441119 RepID=A0A1I5U4V1_9RHOB|nr:phosphodiester glycosidase family protein [Tranquillimonas alkanivorans]SFP90325.1 Uncharacterized protein YigE, DUF2233 family [Tranquillimonas alkanivorans]